MPKTPFDAFTDPMNMTVACYVQHLARQGKAEGRMVMHDQEGQPVAALVLMMRDVPERLDHLDRFAATTDACGNNTVH